MCNFNKNIQRGPIDIKKSAYKGMNLLKIIQKLHLRMEEVKFQKELYNKIIKLIHTDISSNTRDCFKFCVNTKNWYKINQ